VSPRARGEGSPWRRGARPPRAADRILDAAEKVFVERGVSAAGMAEIAEAAGCARGTLYRYFPTRHALHLAYVDRETRRIVRHVAEAVAGIDDPGERATAFVLATLREVRARPGTAAWFAPDASALAARMSRASEVIASFTRTVGAVESAADPLRARWLVRVIVSLLADPEEDEARERALVERFVVPTLLDESLPS